MGAGQRAEISKYTGSPSVGGMIFELGSVTWFETSFLSLLSKWKRLGSRRIESKAQTEEVFIVDRRYCIWDTGKSTIVCTGRLNRHRLTGSFYRRHRGFEVKGLRLGIKQSMRHQCGMDGGTSPVAKWTVSFMKWTSINKYLLNYHWFWILRLPRYLGTRGELPSPWQEERDISDWSAL